MTEWSSKKDFDMAKTHKSEQGTKGRNVKGESRRKYKVEREK